MAIERISYKKVSFFLFYFIFLSVHKSQVTPSFQRNSIKEISAESQVKFFVSETGIPVLSTSSLSIPDPQNHFLPYFYFYTLSAVPAYSVIPKNIKTIRASGELKNFIEKHFKDYIKDDFIITNDFSYSGKQGIVKVKIYAIRKINGEYELLTGLTPEFIYQNTVPESFSERKSATQTSVSVLSSGTWYKLAVPREGVYKLTRSFFTQAGIDVSGINPKNIRIFGTAEGIVPEKNSVARTDDLAELAIYVEGENDNQFDNQDYVLFYAKGTTEWKYLPSNTYTYTLNQYSDTNYYFLTVDQGPGLRITSVDNSALTPNIFVNSYDYYNYHESETNNFLKSGREFFGEYFDFVTSYGFSFNDGNFITGDTLKVFCAVAGRSDQNNSYSVSSGTLSGNIVCAGFPISVYSNYAVVGSVSLKGLNTQGQNLSVSVTKLTSNALGWLDYILVNCRRALFYNSKPFSFRDARSVGSGNNAEFTLTESTPSGQLRVWNISNVIQPFEIILPPPTGNQYKFRHDASQLYEFTVFNPADLPQPVFYGRVPNQNLHSIQNAEMLIITHPRFIQQAQQLALLHQQKDNLNCLIVTTPQIYNEFSSGRPEATGIRDFIKMVYDRTISSSNPLKYVLLFGRGSYYNKNGKTGNTNLIPTYQSQESLNPLSSVATDDFYGLMDAAEGELAETVGSIDLGVGRIICVTPEEANAVINKIQNYYAKDGKQDYESSPQPCADNKYAVMGEWRNHLIFAADDGDMALHMKDADDINSFLKDYPQFVVHKIYVDAYKGISTPGGKRYPDMQAELNQRINKGALLFNYTGHGGEVGLAAERIVDIDIINSWKNVNGLPLFITATCEFSRYDDPDRYSAGELCLLYQDGGAISLMTTCRLAFSSTNKILNQYILNKLFDFSSGYPRLGDVIRYAKSALTQGTYFANFHLLGDPAITLNYPKYKVIVDSLNLHAINANDTVKGLDKIRIKGYISDGSNLLSGFNGYATVNLYDKKNLVVCLLNDPNSSTIINSSTPFTFFARNNLLLSNRVKVVNGRFKSDFVVPKNLLPGFDRWRLNLYATDGQTDASGGDTLVTIGGISSNPVVDNQGPSIKLYLNDSRFVNGGITGQNPVLIAELQDSSGINVSGQGFGYDLTATLNNKDKRVLNPYYTPEVGSYQKGKVRYKFESLKEGNYSLDFKAWDVSNNSNISRLDFVVAPNEKLALERVLNYPNPFSTRTEFFFEHNRACDEIRVTIEIFTISGKSIKKIEKTFYCDGFRPPGIPWDGKDDYGSLLGRGVYLYRIHIHDSSGEKAEKIEKLVILN